jgi:hypothetical protein
MTDLEMMCESPSRTDIFERKGVIVAPRPFYEHIGMPIEMGIMTEHTSTMESGASHTHDNGETQSIGHSCRESRSSTVSIETNSDDGIADETLCISSHQVDIES